LPTEQHECAFLGVDPRRLRLALPEVLELERERLDLPDEPNELTSRRGVIG
jgi:hypothetical protein